MSHISWIPNVLCGRRRQASTRDTPSKESCSTAATAEPSLLETEAKEPSREDLTSATTTPRVNTGTPGTGEAATPPPPFTPRARRGPVPDDFLRICLGIGEDWDDDEYSDAGEAFHSPGGAVCPIALNDDSDDDYDDEDLDDVYTFDHEKLASLLKQGADKEELTDVIEAAMAEAFERRMAMQTAVEEEEDGEGDGKNELTTDGVYDLAGKMTPTRTPPRTPGAHTPPAGTMTPERWPGPFTPRKSGAGGVPGDDLAQRMQQAMDFAQSRAQVKTRRSSAVRKDAIRQAMDTAIQRRRQSVAKAQQRSNVDMTEEIEAARSNALRRHRCSIAKAADVLETAGIDGDGANQSEVDSQINLVQQAMADARKRHRRSIVAAVDTLQMGVGSGAVPAGIAKSTAEKTIAVKKTVATPAKNLAAKSTAVVDANEAEPVDQASVQARIQQAIVAAHERHQRMVSTLTAPPTFQPAVPNSWQPASQQPPMYQQQQYFEQQAGYNAWGEQYQQNHAAWGGQCPDPAQWNGQCQGSNQWDVQYQTPEQWGDAQGYGWGQGAHPAAMAAQFR